MEENICKFAASASDGGEIFAFQFVYETMPAVFGENRTYAAFCVHLVTEGSAVFRMGGTVATLGRGDIFFTFPSLPFTLAQLDDFKYLYLSFVGSHASDLLESVGVTRENPICQGHEDQIDLWFGSLLRCHSGNLSLLAKGILYYTLAQLVEDQTETGAAKSASDLVLRVREAIDQGYANSELSLDYLCRIYRYNSKYVSRRFREGVGVSFTEYLSSCRIRHACALLEKGDCSVREAANSVGYRDPLYFSKVFRRLVGMSPTAYRSTKRKETDS